MRSKLSCALLLMAALLAGCAAGGASSQPDQSAPPPDRSALTAEPEADKSAGEMFVDDPDSPYPMAVESWSVDMDGDGVDELVELWAEKAYFGNEVEPEKLFEGDGMHPYTLVVTRGETVYELPLGWTDDGGPPLAPMYWDKEGTGRCWIQDRSGAPILVMWFDTISAGGMGNLNVYAVAFQNGEPVFLSVPCYDIQTEFDQETMIAQVTVPETGHTQTLDLNEWLVDHAERDPDGAEPVYREDGTLDWPLPPSQIDGHYFVEQAGEGITLRQYTYGRYHSDGIADLVTTLNWENGQPVVLDQRLEVYDPF